MTSASHSEIGFGVVPLFGEISVAIADQCRTIQDIAGLIQTAGDRASCDAQAVRTALNQSGSAADVGGGDLGSGPLEYSGRYRFWDGGGSHVGHHFPGAAAAA